MLLSLLRDSRELDELIWLLNPPSSLYISVLFGDTLFSLIDYFSAEFDSDITYIYLSCFLEDFREPNDDLLLLIPKELWRLWSFYYIRGVFNSIPLSSFKFSSLDFKNLEFFIKIFEKLDWFISNPIICQASFV